MGKRRRKEKKAARKAKRAARKEKRAEKARRKGKTSKADRLQKRADKLKQKASDIETQINGQIIRGLTARVIDTNSLGNITIRASWNYLADELTNYESFTVSIQPSSPFRSSTWNTVVNAPINATGVDIGPTKKMRYIVKLFGVYDTSRFVGKPRNLLDRMVLKKSK